MVKTILKIKSNNTWYLVDLYDTLPISATISSGDLTDLSSSSYSFTKTFVIPGTKNNHNLFKNFFNVSGIDFNPLAKTECVVEKSGSIIFEGFLRLNAVIINDNLTDLKLNDLNHENNYDNITTSWEYSGTTGGLFNGQVLYPLINYGLSYDTNGNPQFEIATTGSNAFTGASNSVPEEYFKPAIQLKSVVDRIFSSTTYTYDSTFFNSDYFKSIYMSLANNGELGVIRNDDETGNQNKFKVYASQTIAYPYDEDDPRKPLVFNTLDPDGYDPLGNYTLDDDFPNSSNDDFLNFFNVPIAGDYFFNLKFRYTNNTGQNFPSYFKIKAYKSTSPFNIDTTGTLFYETGGSGLTALGTPTDANILFSGSLQSNEYVALYIEPVTSIGFPELGVRIYGFEYQDNMVWDLYESPTLVGTTQVVMKQQMPDIDCQSFIQGLIDTFKLVVTKNPTEKVITFEPYNYYFDNDQREVRDWSEKVDYESTIRIETLDFNLPKELLLTYSEEREEYYNEYYIDNVKQIFGRKLFSSNSTILTGRDTVTLPFAPTPTDTISGSSYIVIPKTYEIEIGDAGEEFKRPAMTQPHLFFWVGNRYMYNNESGTTPTQWYLQSGATSIEWTTYPCVSHLSHLTSGSSQTFSDLNFESKWDFFEANNDVINAYSSYSIYNSFWKGFIDSLYSNEARRMRARILLDPIEFKDIKLNDRIFIKDNYWRIEEITDGDLVNEKLVQVSLIKDLNNINYVEPPSPTYTVLPNETQP